LNTRGKKKCAEKFFFGSVKSGFQKGQKRKRTTITERGNRNKNISKKLIGGGVLWDGNVHKAERNLRWG